MTSSQPSRFDDSPCGDRGLSSVVPCMQKHDRKEEEEEQLISPSSLSLSLSLNRSYDRCGSRGRRRNPPTSFHLCLLECVSACVSCLFSSAVHLIFFFLIFLPFLARACAMAGVRKKGGKYALHCVLSPQPAGHKSRIRETQESSRLSSLLWRDEMNANVKSPRVRECSFFFLCALSCSDR